MTDDGPENVRYPNTVAPQGAVLAHPIIWEERVNDVSVLRILNVLLRHPRATIAVPAGLAAVVLLVSLLLPRSYSSGVTFMPQATESAFSQFAGFAADFGIPLPMSSAGGSPQFYESLLRTRGLLTAAVMTEYEFGVGEEPDAERRTGTLIQLYGLDGADSVQNIEDAVERLHDDLSITADATIGTVRASVTTRWPDLSLAVAERLLELVDEFDAVTRQSQAAAERRFTAERLTSARSELREMEDTLQAFLLANRRYDRAPELRFEFERLQRKVALRQQVVSSLAVSHEEARIEEILDTPVLTIVDPPYRPAEPDSRRLGLRAFVALLLGLFIGSMWALGHEFVLSARRTDPDAVDEVARHARDLARFGKDVWARTRATGTRRQGPT